jgi:hypothetical protein
MLDTDITPPIYPRGIQPRVLDALADTPVVLLSGPRQAGKTTFKGWLGSLLDRSSIVNDAISQRGGCYFNLLMAPEHMSGADGEYFPRQGSRRFLLLCVSSPVFLF